MSTNMSRGSSLQAEEPPVQMQEGRRVCVQGRARRQVWLEEQGISMRSGVWPDHVGLQHIRRCLMSVKDVHS